MLTPAMWFKALRLIPRVSRAEWDGLDVVSRWLVATRAAVLVMTAVSAVIGGLLALKGASFSPLSFALCVLGLCLAHATNNLVNDLTDHVKGVDKDNYFRTQYGPHPLEHGLMSFRQMLVYAAVTGSVALLCGGVLVWQTGAVTLTLLAAGAFFVLFYTWPLKHIGLGEPAVLVVWGPLMVGGTHYVVTGGVWSDEVTLISLVYALGPTTVLFGKHTDKLVPDKAKGIRTMPVLLGEALSRYVVIAMAAGQLVCTLGLIVIGWLGWPLLVVVLSLPTLVQLLRVYSKPRPDERPDEFPVEAWPTYLSAYAFVHTRRFGVLFLLGLILDVAPSALG
ncbi:MAG: prenyltransferase [Myxococcota bacterium]